MTMRKLKGWEIILLKWMVVLSYDEDNFQKSPNVLKVKVCDENGCGSSRCNNSISGLRPI